uniref:Sex-determining region Y protein n=1 Tax=Caenorhabditis japonica TaxID=281687 RepID=A0A8R1E2U0_CAEJA
MSGDVIPQNTMTTTASSIGSSIVPNMNGAQQVPVSVQSFLPIVADKNGSDSFNRSITPEKRKSPTPLEASIENQSLPVVSKSNSPGMTLAEIISQTASAAVSISNTVNSVSSVTTLKTTREARIKRPMNAFMVWSQQRRQQISATGQKFHNSDISKMLGAEWRKMDERDKIPFVDRAKQLREEHFRDHPDYVYRPRRRKRMGKGSGSVDSLNTDDASGSPTLNYNNMYSNAFCQLFVQQLIRNSLINGNGSPPNSATPQIDQLINSN